MVIDYRLAATFTHRHHVMQTERYIFFVAVAFTLKITLTDRAHMSHQTLIRVLRPLPLHAPSPQHPKRTISFPGEGGFKQFNSYCRLGVSSVGMCSNTRFISFYDSFLTFHQRILRMWIKPESHLGHLMLETKFGDFGFAAYKNLCSHLIPKMYIICIKIFVRLRIKSHMRPRIFSIVKICFHCRVAK